jgi:fructokinase
VWQDEERLQKALYFANVCGAITVKERGAISALPTKDVVLQACIQNTIYKSLA